MDGNVRRAEARDASAIKALRLEMITMHPDAFVVDAQAWNRRSEEFWATFAAKGAHAPDEAVFLGWFAGQPVAMAHVGIDGEIATLGMLYVRPEARGRGLGAALLAAREDWARTQGAVRARADITIGNISSETLHAARGWTPDTALGPGERRWHKLLIDSPRRQRDEER